MNICADLHTHTIVSGHAYGTIREMAYAASEIKLKLLGISEHAPGIPGTAEPIYYCALGQVPRELYGVKLLFGSEINVLNDGTLSMPEDVIERLDYALVGIHEVCYEDQGRERNTDNLIECMKHEKVFFVSHPDDDKTPLDYERLVKAAKEYHVALEVNNSSFLKPESRLNCFENYRTILKYCKEYDSPIVINSDAHDPSRVGKVDLACRFVEENGFDERLVLNTEIKKVEEFIGKGSI
ncbi:MAG: phosphatase [Lachnospiraceae bacterium]|nr:phosphatase [Lachnospiraceae bacterium]